MRSTVILAVVAGLFLSATPAFAGNQTCESETVAETVKLINKQRKKRGLKPVRCTAKLLKAALIHSKDMCEREFFSHADPEGNRFVHRFKKVGIVSHTGGENIAMGQSTPQQVVKGWMKSKGHRENILDAEYRRMGIGFVPCDDNPYWTQTFAGRAPKGQKAKQLARGMEKDASSKADQVSSDKPTPEKKNETPEKAKPEDSPDTPKKVAKKSKSPSESPNKTKQKAKSETEETPKGSADKADPKKPADTPEKTDDKKEKKRTRLGEPKKKNWDAIAEDLEKDFEGFMEKAPE